MGSLTDDVDISPIQVGAEPSRGQMTGVENMTCCLPARDMGITVISNEQYLERNENMPCYD